MIPRRLARINTIWQKELLDTLRDRRTLIAMVLVPIVLYPVMILGSLQGLEFQISRLKQEKYTVVVTSRAAQRWLQTQIDADLARRGHNDLQKTAEALVAADEAGKLPAAGADPPLTGPGDRTQAAAEDARRQPPEYEVIAVPNEDVVRDALLTGAAHVGVVLDGPPPTAQGGHTTSITLFLDETEIRSQIAAAGLEAILNRAGETILHERLKRVNLSPEFIRPLVIKEQSTAPPEKVGGSILGQIVPLILIVMTITGALYPAIDLTAGERERGTLETLMVAPVPPVDLIAGKFVVVALIGMMSAALNLLSIGGTIWLGGLGDILTRDQQVVIPLWALPWVLVLLVPLAIMFSALLLAVCSFARSFKEAQNYVMPVLVGAMIPAVVGILPGTRLDGPMKLIPITNITILTRDLFTGKIDLGNIVWVTASTTLYAGAAVAIAGRLFGQEAVLFSDSGSLKTLFVRKFFKRVPAPSVAQTFLLLALTFSLNFFAQQSLVRAGLPLFGTGFVIGFAIILVTLYVLLPLGTAAYARVELGPAFALRAPPAAGIGAALCFGASTWILARAWFVFQSTWLPIPPAMLEEYQKVEAQMAGIPPVLAFLAFALLPAFCEEFFFRGYALSGLRRSLGSVAAVVITAAAFGLSHHSVFRLFVTAGLGLLFGLVVLRFGSLWLAMLAHLMHNGLSVLAANPKALQPVLVRLGYAPDTDGLPAWPWLAGGTILACIGLLLCAYAAPRGRDDASSAAATASPIIAPPAAAEPERQRGGLDQNLS